MERCFGQSPGSGGQYRSRRQLLARVVGTGGFGITYEAEDINLGTMVAIKEYYPFDFGDRDRTMSVRPKSDRHKKTFDILCGDCAEHRRAASFCNQPRLAHQLGVQLAGQDGQFGPDQDIGELQETGTDRHMVAFLHEDLGDDASVAVLDDLGLAIDDDGRGGDDGSGKRCRRGPTGWSAAT
jgi:hypothetical protein